MLDQEPFNDFAGVPPRLVVVSVPLLISGDPCRTGNRVAQKPARGILVQVSQADAFEFRFVVGEHVARTQ